MFYYYILLMQGFGAANKNWLWSHFSWSSSQSPEPNSSPVGANTFGSTVEAQNFN